MADVMIIFLCAAGVYAATNLLSDACPALFSSPRPVMARARTAGRRSRY